MDAHTHMYPQHNLNEIKSKKMRKKMSKVGSVTGDNAKATYLVGVEENEGRDIHYVDYTKRDSKEP